VWAAWCQEQRDEVVDSFFVEPQNLGRLVTTWEPSHEWCLHQVCGVCTPSLWGLQWFTRKPLGYSVSHKTEAEDSTRRCGHPDRFNRPRGAVRPPSRSNRPGGGGGVTALVAAAEKLRSGGHASESQGLRRG
jgi:hypothetical protein